MPSLPWRPCDAMKIRSQPPARAAATIACAGLSLTTWRDSHGTPSARAAASALASSSCALPSVGVLVFVARDQAQHVGVAAQRAGGVGDGVEEGDARAERRARGRRRCRRPRSRGRCRRRGRADGDTWTDLVRLRSILGSRCVPAPSPSQGGAPIPLPRRLPLPSPSEVPTAAGPFPGAGSRPGMPWPIAPLPSLASPTTCLLKVTPPRVPRHQIAASAPAVRPRAPARPPGHPGAGAGRLRQDLAARAVAARASGAGPRWSRGCRRSRGTTSARFVQSLALAVRAAAGRPTFGHTLLEATAPSGLEGRDGLARRDRAIGARRRPDRRRGRPAARRHAARRWPICFATRLPTCAPWSPRAPIAGSRSTTWSPTARATRIGPAELALPARRDPRARARRASARASTATRPRACTSWPRAGRSACSSRCR